MRRGVVIRTVISNFTFDGAERDPVRKAIRDALIAFMAALSEAQAEANKEAQRAGSEHARRHGTKTGRPAYRGKLGSDDLVFPLPDGLPYSPDKLSRDWGNIVRDKKLPRGHVPRATPHSHASALIAVGIDIVTVSRRLGHGSPAITVMVYAHLFTNTDAAAATAIEATPRPRT